MKEFRFLRAENGGWVVFGVVEPHLIPPLKGAYSSFEDLLAGLPALLQPAPAEAPSGTDVAMAEGDV